MLRLKKEGEGFFEVVLNIFMPIWLPIKAIKMMIEEIREERRKKKEKEER
ncbi:hypothetical protein KAT63_00990 [Candidatus Parcubacteria bacterium]|nr:hypothetical protein [Candidatus Parcubacteria bacterium]